MPVNPLIGVISMARRDGGPRKSPTGLGDLAAAVDLDWSVVRADDVDGNRMSTEVEPPTELCHLLTVRGDDGALTAYPVDSWCHTGWQGPSLLDRLPPGGTDRLDLASPPASGLHVDVPDRTAHLWLGFTGDGLRAGRAGAVARMAGGA
jgi:hypothetical protein